MAHELATAASGEVMMAYSGETPWHGLGKPVSNDLTPAQMLAEAGLDWEVKKYKAFIEVDKKRHATGQFGLTRTDKEGKVHLLSNISKDWNPVQNSEAFDFFNDFVSHGEMEMHTAGALKDGRIVWALAKVLESFTILGKDRTDAYLLFTNPHIYGWSTSVRMTGIRVVCNNTLDLSLSLKAKTQVAIAHHKKFNADEVKELLGIAKFKLASYKEAAEFLASKRYTPESMQEYFNEVFPKAANAKRDKLTKQAAKAAEIVETQPGAEFAPGTWWNAFNAVTYLVDHEMGKSQDNRLSSAWYGSGAKLKKRALVRANSFATAS